MRADLTFPLFFWSHYSLSYFRAAGDTESVPQNPAFVTTAESCSQPSLMENTNTPRHSHVEILPLLFSPASILTYKIKLTSC